MTVFHVFGMGGPCIARPSSTVGLLLILATTALAQDQVNQVDATQDCSFVDASVGHITIPEGVTNIPDVSVDLTPFAIFGIPCTLAI